MYIFDPVIPDDRLVNAIGSPGQRAGKDQDQATLFLERDEALNLIGLVRHVQLVRNCRANLYALPNGIAGL